MKKRYILIALLMLVLATLACNRTQATPTPQVETETPADAETSTPGAEVAGIPTNTPTSSATPSLVDVTPSLSTPTLSQGTPECIYNADFVADVTFPDDAELEPGTAFVKTWRIRNSGTCAWELGTSWGFELGDQMAGPDSVAVPITQPGDTADVSVNLTAPATPDSYTGYWRMRRPSGEMFGTPIYVRIVVPGSDGIGTPSPSPTPTPTGLPGVGPTIKHFRANVKQADPGDTVTLEWATENAASVTLYHLMPTGQLGSYWDVDLSGSFSYNIDASERNRTGFVLLASDSKSNITQETLLIPLLCPDTWFFTPAPDICPAATAIVSVAAEEKFEHGTMIWVQEQDLIYVLFDDDQQPGWYVYTDEWSEDDPQSDPSIIPPNGRYQPVRGFGLVWREQSGVRDRLGWAMELEVGFTTSVQRTSYAKYNEIYLRALDGGVWKLLPMSSGWEKIK